MHDLVDATGASQPLVSQHLKVLRQASLIDGRRRGRETAYMVADDHVLHIAIDAITHATERTARTHMSTCTTHDAHTHAHGPDCGHASVDHGGHRDDH